jgi:hypothetical protein
MIPSCLFALMILSSPSVEGNAPVALENKHLLVEFSAKDGSITRLRNKRAQMDLLTVAPRSGRPWALLLTSWELASDFESFRITPSRGKGVQTVALEWKTRYRITIKAEARLAEDSDELVLRCSAENAGDRTVLAFRYPAIQGIGTLSEDGARDRLLHSTMMGALFFDPFHLFQADVAGGSGMALSRYPNGFHGSALQLMAYYAKGRGGFYIAAKDGDCGDKDLNFFKAADNKSLTCEIAHIQGDARPGKSLVVGYPVVIAALTRGTWYEAAERYRSWAVQQSWCKRGTVRRRVAAGDACRWLIEEIGAVGMWWPFRNDIREDIVRTRRLYGAPLLHLDLWWSHGPSHEAAHRNGDRFGPFYFPFLAQKGRDAYEANSADRIVPSSIPGLTDWISMCPAQPGWRKIVCESAEDMAGAGPLRHHQIWVDENRKGCRADCLYYDIGPCAGVPTHCYATNHAHAPGAGGAITRAYVSLIDETRRIASRVRGAYVPVGTECVSEPFVGCLDLYFSRNAGLNPDMENSLYVRHLTWLPDGRMEIIPLFAFVYHEHGPMAVQWVHPVSVWDVPKGEDLFTWAEARTVLWGGLIVSAPLPPVSEDRVRFVRSLVSARTQFAHDYLAYGRMQHPPEFRCGTLDLDHGFAEGGWLRKIRFSGSAPDIRAFGLDPKELDRKREHPEEITVAEWSKSLLAIPATPSKTRTLRVPSVLCQAYTLDDDRLGILLVNLRSNAEELVHLPVDPVSYGLAPGKYEIQQAGSDDRRLLGESFGPHEIELKLPPRNLILVEARRIGGL